MMVRAYALGLALLCPVTALAQDLTYSDEATSACISSSASAEAVKACVGNSADACMMATPDGITTIGMSECLGSERAFWDRMLNDRYQALLAKTRVADAAAVGSLGGGNEEALRQMQRAWISYRDAACDFARVQWGGGTGGGPATLRCLMELTAGQAIYLHTAWIGD